MRYVVTLLLTVSGLVALASSGPAAAKSGIEIAPASGPPGSTVHVSGFGFRSGEEVRLGIATLGGPLSDVFFSDSDADFMQLAAVIARNGEFKSDIVMPSLDVIQSRFGKEVEIIAITDNHPDVTQRPEHFFLVGERFSFASPLPAIAAAGTGGSSSSLPVATLSASLGAAGALLFAIGWRRRAR